MGPEISNCVILAQNEDQIAHLRLNEGFLGNNKHGHFCLLTIPSFAAKFEKNP